MLKSSFLAAILAAGVLSIPASAQIAPNNPVGLWELHWSFDTSAPMARVGIQDICFLSNGTWFGTTFPAWSGHWFQKGNSAAGNGDHVSMTGNYASNVGNDGFQIDFQDVNAMSGTWSEWRDNFVFLAWVRVSFARLKGTCGTDDMQNGGAPGTDDENPVGKIRK